MIFKLKKQTFYNNLNNLKKENSLVSLYTDKNDLGHFSLGYIVDVNDMFYILASLSPNGIYDGFVLRRTSEVVQITYNGKYENMIQKLEKIHNVKHEEIPQSDKNLVVKLLDFAMHSKYIVSIWSFDEDCDAAVGYVADLENDKCKIVGVSEYGEDTGEIILNISDITEIDCNTEEESRRKLLFEN